MNSKTCSARKPCTICKRSFGRHLKELKFGESTRQFESKAAFGKRQTCGPKCNYALVSWALYMRKQEALERRESNDNPAFRKAYNDFLYKPIAGSIWP